VLLLANDASLRELMLGCLGRCRTTACGTPAEARKLLRVARYALVLITNFGVGPFHAVEVIPADRDYAVLFLTGYMDARLASLCRDRSVPWRRMPLEPIPPLAFLDFETVGLAIPVWNGCHPYDAVPVQFSCDVVEAGGRVTHHAWLAEGPEDPGPALAERVVAACAGARTVVAYNAPFERGCLHHLGDEVPHLAEPLGDIGGRLADLLPVVRNYVYHPDFGGSFSLKSVLPALVPELRYDALAIADGESASLELVRLLFHGNELEPEVRQQLRYDLLRYCHQDTWGLVQLLERLHQESRSGACAKAPHKAHPGH
jgi:hypothetical protein